MVNLKIEGNKKKVLDIIIILLLLYTAAHLFHSTSKYSYNVEGDFDYQFGLAEKWVNTGEPPWWEHEWQRYTYPFFYHLLISPLTFFDLEKIRPILYISSFMLLIISVYLLAVSFSNKKIKWRDWAVMVILTGNFWPALVIITQYKVEMWELFLISLAIYLFRKRKDWLVGIFTTIATHLKYFPGVLLLYFFYKREKKIIISSIISIAVILLITSIAFGPSNMLEFFTSLSSRFASVDNKAIDLYLISNVALTGAILRLFAVGPAMVPIIAYPKLAQYTALIARLAIILLLAYLFRKKMNRESPNQNYIEINLALLSIFFIAPYATNQYAILILPAFIFSYFFIKNNWNKINWTKIILFALAYLAVGHFVPLGILHYLPKIPYFDGNVYAVWWYSIPTIGYILLGIALIMIGKWKKPQENTKSLS